MTQRKISRRKFCAALGASSAMLSYSADCWGVRTTAKKPNVVYIIADDLGWGDIEVYNPESKIPTPFMNTLAKQGRRFTDMHASAAVCTPSRYSVLTGRYPWRSRLEHGVLNGHSPMLIEPDRLTVPAMLKQAGYSTAGVGKWHLGLGEAPVTDFAQPLRPGPVTCGFDYYYGIPASLDMPPYLYFENDRTVELASIEDPGNHEPRGVTWRPGMRAADFDIPQVLPTLTEKACSVIRERAAHKDKPFFLYFAMPAPHYPWVPLPKYKGKSQAGEYGDYVVEVDAMVGAVLDGIQESGAAENTIVVLASDHGADWKPGDIQHWNHRSNANWRGEKADIWEGGHRVPFLVRWPGHVPAGSVCDETCSLTDLLATLTDLLGRSLPDNAGEDSFSMLPAWLGGGHGPVREAIVHESNDGMFSIRQREWKLALGLGSGGFSQPRHVDPAPEGPRGQLYNLRDDPEEKQNLWLEHPDVVQKLTAMLDRYRQSGRSRSPHSG